MVELIVEWLKCNFDVSKIHHPSGFFTHRAAHINLNAEGVPMKATAFMACGDIGQAVRSF